MHFKNHCHTNSLKGIFLTKGNVLLSRTKQILDINNVMKFYKKISIIYSSSCSHDTAHFIWAITALGLKLGSNIMWQLKETDESL